MELAAKTWSSTPASTPSSPSTDTPRAWAYLTTSRVSSTFSSKGRAEPSIITEVYPPSMAATQESKFLP